MNDSGLGRLLGVLVSPGKTFRSIAERPTWWAVLLVLALAGTGVGFLTTKKMDFEAMARQRATQQNQPLNQEQLDKGVQFAKTFAPVWALVAGLILGPGIYMLLAVLFWTFFRLLGSEMSYPQSLSVTVHAYVPTLVLSLLAVPVLLSRQTISPDDAKKGILLSNLAFLAPEGSSAAVQSLLGSIDFFSLWVVVLLALGYRIVAKVSGTAATATVVALWLLYVAGRAGLAYLFA
jgi:hypothetical protein